MTDELIGKRVRYRSPIHGEVYGEVTGIHWEPDNGSLRPSMVANILLDDGHVGTEYVHGLTVMNDWERPDPDVGRNDVDFSLTIQRQHDRYTFAISAIGTENVIRNGGAPSYTELLAHIRRTLGELGYLSPVAQPNPQGRFVPTLQLPSTAFPPQPERTPAPEPDVIYDVLQDADDDRELRANETVQWCGYWLKPRYVGSTVNGDRRMEGMTVSRGGVNAAPGAVWAQTVKQGKKMIAAIVLAERLDMLRLASDQHDDQHTFHLLMELTR